MALRDWNPDEAMASLVQEREVMEKGHVEQAVDTLNDNLPMAVMSIVHLAQHSPNERIRLDAAKYVVERVMGRIDSNGGSTGGKDVFDNLLEQCIVTVDSELGN